MILSSRINQKNRLLSHCHRSANPIIISEDIIACVGYNLLDAPCSCLAIHVNYNLKLKLEMR